MGHKENICSKRRVAWGRPAALSLVRAIARQVWMLLTTVHRELIDCGFQGFVFALGYEGSDVAFYFINKLKQALSTKYLNVMGA